MYKVGDTIYTFDSELDAEGNVVRSYLASHEVAEVVSTMSGTSYKFVINGRLYSVPESDAHAGLDDARKALFAIYDTADVCGCCRRVFSKGEGVLVGSTFLCNSCAKVVVQTMSKADNATPHTDKKEHVCTCGGNCGEDCSCNK